MMRVVSGLAVGKLGTILMGLRPKGKKRGELWELPGGKIDPGETPQVALTREWKEELGITITVGDFIAPALIELEIPYAIELYRVHSDEFFKVGPNAHDALKWVDPVVAMDFMPCSPGYYLHYKWMIAYLNAQWEGT